MKIVVYKKNKRTEAQLGGITAKVTVLFKNE